MTSLFLLARCETRVHFLAVLLTHAPYALSPTAFRFPALAALAGRAPLGGHREVALAAYLAARLAEDAFPERGLAASMRVERAVHAKAWLSTLSLPTPIRPALTRLVEASGGECTALSEAIRSVMAVTSAVLDSAALAELETLAASLSR